MQRTQDESLSGMFEEPCVDWCLSRMLMGKTKWGWIRGKGVGNHITEFQNSQNHLTPPIYWLDPMVTVPNTVRSLLPLLPSLDSVVRPIITHLQILSTPLPQLTLWYSTDKNNLQLSPNLCLLCPHTHTVNHGWRPAHSILINHTWNSVTNLKWALRVPQPSHCISLSPYPRRPFHTLFSFGNHPPPPLSWWSYFIPWQIEESFHTIPLPCLPAYQLYAHIAAFSNVTMDMVLSPLKTHASA